jgi:phage shock protein A
MIAPMGIFDRMGRVLSSNVNALLDKAEDPKKSLELLLTEMKEQLPLARGEVTSSLASEKQLEKKVAELDGEAEKWAKRAELALRADDEALAREALAQKKRVVGDRDRAEALLAEARATTRRLKSDLARMEEKHAELEAKKGTLAARINQAKGGGGAEGLGSRGGSSAFEEFRRMEGQIDRQDAEAQAATEVEAALDPGKASGGLSKEELEAKFARLEGGTKKDAIDDELQALKAKIRVK